MSKTKQAVLYSKEYYLKNRERLLVWMKEYDLKHKELKSVYMKDYDLKNKERKSAYMKDYYLKNKEKRSTLMKDYYQKNQEKILTQKKNYGGQHKKQIAAQRKGRYISDFQYKLEVSLRARLHVAMKGNYKTGSAVRDLGCTIQELKFYLEGQFQDGMTWENHSLEGWHIDHKIPLAFFDLTNREQFLQAFHYTNLQPMWAIENLKKGKKLKYEI